MDKYLSQKFTTAELVSLLLDGNTRWLEVSLNDGVFNATHLILPRKNKLIDCGIDSRDVTWDPNDFIKFYKYAYWKVDQISTLSSSDASETALT